MFSLTSVSDADYYLGGSRCGECAHESAADYQFGAIRRQGEPPGQWDWRGTNALGQTGTIVPDAPSGEAFKTALNKLEHPDTGGQLGRKPPEYKTPEEKVAAYKAKHPYATPEQIAQATLRAESSQSSATHALDGTFSPGKSWSVLHAAFEWDGRQGDAELLWAALEKGVAAALDLIFEELAFVRLGASGPKVAGRSTMRYERPAGMPIATFRHHRSRDGDPQTHIHTMLLNRVLCADGQWRSLHGMGLYRFKKMVDAVFTRTAEAEAARTLGLRFAATPDGKSREIVGVSESARACFSSRSRALSEKAQELVDQFTARHGEPPTDRQMWKMLQQATLDTRQSKRAVPERDTELDQFEATLREETRESFEDVLTAVDQSRAWDALEVEPLDRDMVVAQALADLEAKRSTWNRSDLWFALSRRMPDMLGCESDEVRGLISSLADEVIRSDQVVSLEAAPVAEVPGSLRDSRTGRSVFEAPEGERYTTKAHLEREDTLVSWLGRRGAKAIPEGTEQALLAGLGLSDEQLRVAAAVLASDRRIELINAAAGVGKSRLTAALSDALTRHTGRGLVGLTVAQNAAEVLAAEGVEHAMNIASWFDFLDRDRRGEAGEVERAWFTVPRGATIVVDESSMVDTAMLTRLLAELSRARASKIVLVGDTEQLAAVGASGAFEMLIEERERQELEAGPQASQFVPQAGDFTAPSPTREKVPVPARRPGVRSTGAHVLSEVRRFENDWERTASAQIREGDASALTQYDARARVFGKPDADPVINELVDGFVGDHLAGQDSVIVVGSAEVASDVSSRVRERLVRAGHVERGGVRLRDQTVAGLGDLVQTRRNDLRGTGVVNREVWQVVGTSDRGDLEVRKVLDREGRGLPRYDAPLQLPAAYVKTDVTLAYAATPHATQGQTRDTSWTLVDRWSDRPSVYVGMSRGRQANHVGVVTADNETPLGRLADVVGRDHDATQAARTAIAEEKERARHLGHLGPQWTGLVTEERAVQHRHVIRMALGPEQSALVLQDPKVGGLLHLLRCAEMSGHPVRALLDDALPAGSLDGARSPAALAYMLIDDELRRTPLGPGRPGSTYEFRTPQTPTTSEGMYALRLAKEMDDRTAELGHRQAEDPEPWALERFGPVPEEIGARYAWVGQVAAVCAFREQFGWTHPTSPIGPSPTRQNPEKLWAWRRGAQMLGVDPLEQELGLLSLTELMDRVQRWERIQEWMPRHVDDDLREAHTGLQQATRQAVLERAQGDEEFALGWEAEALVMRGRVEVLEETARHRATVYEAKAPEREAAEAARAELGRRDEVAQARQEEERPLPEEPEYDEDREPEVEPEPVPEVDDVELHAAVFAHWSQRRVPGLQALFGSLEWLELADDDPAKAAAVTAAAMRWWHLGEPLDRDVEEVTAQLEAYGADQPWSADGLVSYRPRERGEGDDGPDMVLESEVSWEAMDPTADVDVLSGVFRFVSPHLSGEAPAFGSRDWVALDVADPVKTAAEVRAATRWWNAGDSLDDRRARLERAREVEASHAVAEAVAQHREEMRQEAIERRVEADRAERERVAVWEREYAASHGREPEAVTAGTVDEPAELVELFVEAPAGEVVWPEVTAPPAPEPEPTEVEPVSAVTDEPPLTPPEQEPGSAPIDRSRYAALLEAAERQRVEDEARREQEAAERAAAEAERREPEGGSEHEAPEPEPAEPSRAEKDAQIREDLAHARAAVQRLAEQAEERQEQDRLDEERAGREHAEAELEQEREQEMADQ